jgi:hypothetical protein
MTEISVTVKAARAIQAGCIGFHREGYAAADCRSERLGEIGA